jgi:hypothetical protein
MMARINLRWRRDNYALRQGLRRINPDATLEFRSWQVPEETNTRS